MLLYIVRHGEPIYSNDTLTPLGSKQAEALVARHIENAKNSVLLAAKKRNEN